MSTLQAPARSQTLLTEQIVMDGFHLFLSKALAQAKAERLLDEETLASAEADLMVAGPALCLYFAALRSSTSPPSIPLPRGGLPQGTPPLILNSDTVPPAFLAFFSIWQTLTPKIQALPGEQQHDLARVICGHDPISSNTSAHDSIRRMALDLRAVAIEISQRRTFQERYQADLQAALDHGRPPSEGRRTPSPLRATFVPPPGYESEKPLPLSPPQTPQRYPRPLSPTLPQAQYATIPNGARTPSTGPTTPTRLSPYNPNHPLPPVPNGAQPPAQAAPPQGHARTPSGSMFLEPPTSPTGPRTRSRPSTSLGSISGRPSSPTFLTAHDPAILTIRETLYAALADVIARTPEIRGLLKTDPTRAYFASVGLAILDVSLKSLTPQGTVRAVLGAELRLEDIPRSYIPLMQELQAIAARSRQLEDEDNNRAIEMLTAGEDTLPEPRMDRVHRMLIKGVARGWEEARESGVVSYFDETDAMANAAFESQERRSARDPNVVRARSRDRSPEGTVLQLTNRINALALAMMRLPAFRERQSQVFKVLAGAR